MAAVMIDINIKNNISFLKKCFTGCVGLLTGVADEPELFNGGCSTISIIFTNLIINFEYDMN